MFEFDYRGDKCIFKTVISPTDEAEIRNILCEIFESIPGCKNPKGKGWVVHFEHTFKRNVEEILKLDDQEIKKYLDEEWGKVREIVAKVENALMERGEELKKLA